MELPKCCGKEMRINIETDRFIELRCSECGDVVFVKKGAPPPQMLDD